MKFIENIKEKEYTEFVINHENSHFLKSYEWGQISKERKFTPYYVGVKDGNKLVASALLLKKSLPFGYCYFYIPRGFTIDYKNEKLIIFLTEEIKKFTKKHKSIFFKIDPDIMLHEIDINAKPIKDGKNNYDLVNFLKKLGYKHKKLNYYFEGMQPRYTFRVDTKSDMDTIRKKYSKSVLRWIKQANKFQIEVGIGNKKNVKDFVRLMKITEKRQGFYSHEYDFYYKFYEIFSKNKYIDLVYATANKNKILEVINKDIESIKNSDNETRLNKLLNQKKHFENLESNKEEIVSSYFNVNYGNKSWYLYGANNMDYKDTFANYKLFDFQIENAHNLEKELLDEFGTIGDPNSKKSTIGLHEFKKKFGGVYTEFIGEFDFVTNKFMYFLFTKLVPLYRKPFKLIKHMKVKIQKEK